MVSKKNLDEKKAVKKSHWFFNRWQKKIFCLCLFFLLAVFLLLNIFYSQNVSSFYLGLINQDKNTAVAYLKKIKLLPFFKDELKKLTKIFGKDTPELVFKEERETKIKIKKLEAALERNPKASEVLYVLSQFYKESGNVKKAEEYLRKAKAVNPTIK